MTDAKHIEKTSLTFFDALNKGDMDTFLGTLADNVKTYEPVGTPANEGHQGVMNWLGSMQGFESWKTIVDNIYVAGSSAAVAWHSEGRTMDGKDVALQGIDIHEYDDAGQIVSVKGYFDPTPIMAAFSQS